MRTRPETLALRTYTPIRWDAALGSTQLIGFTHGDGPATEWFRGVAVDDTCEVFGPRSSINARALTGPVVFVGDESSVALACALRTVTTDVKHVFEATDPDELASLLADLGFTDNVGVVPRNADAALLQSVREAAQASAAAFDLHVAGDARTVHTIRRDARTWVQPPRSVKGKAYWAPGRAGLD